MIKVSELISLMLVVVLPALGNTAEDWRTWGRSDRARPQNTFGFGEDDDQIGNGLLIFSRSPMPH